MNTYKCSGNKMHFVRNCLGVAWWPWDLAFCGKKRLTIPTGVCKLIMG